MGDHPKRKPPATTADARDAYVEAGARVQEAAEDLASMHRGLVSPSDKLTAVQAEFGRAAADLAVSALDDYMRASEKNLESARTNERAVRWMTFAIMIATVVYAAATIVFYRHIWSQPPQPPAVVNITLPAPPKP